MERAAEYSHHEGQSVTGGYLYRGAALGALAGAYLFGDFIDGRCVHLPLLRRLEVCRRVL